MMTARLSAQTLALVDEASVPGYDRHVRPTIAHLGVGAFARAHVGTYADDLLERGWPAAIRGVSLRGRTAEDQLGPQDGLYSIAEREPDGEEPLRVVGSIVSVATGVDAAVDAIASPDTSLVTLTVTEKGYEAGGPALDVLVRGLDRRRRAGLPPPVVASLDNVIDNGDVLRAGVAAVADPPLAGWIAEEVPFPSSVVDRMVPATTPADLVAIAERLGVTDAAAVLAERHRSWVISGVDGLPPLEQVGVEVVADVESFQRRKLWLLNGPHSALAYCGLLAGCTTIAEAAQHPVVEPFVRAILDDVLEVADVPDGANFAADALRRFRNASLGHTCLQVGVDGSRKLPQRLLPVVERRRAEGRSTWRFAVVVAAWLAAVDRVGDVVPEGILDAEITAAAGRLDRLGLRVLEEET